MNNFFVKCNMVIRSEMDFVKHNIQIKLPFYFHIKDLKNSFLSETDENELEFYGREIYFQNEEYKKLQKYKEYLSYVDLYQFTLEDSEENNDILQYTIKHGKFRIFKDINCLYDFLTIYLGFNEIDFNEMKIFIREQQIKLANNFTRMIEDEIEIGSNKKEPNESYMMLRCTYELNHSATVFPENANKSISEYSFRELKTQRVYIGRKCEIEKIQYDEVMNNKGGTGK